MRVTTLMSLAVVLVVVGTLLLVIYGLGQSEPTVVQAANAVSSGSPGPSRESSLSPCGPTSS